MGIQVSFALLAALVVTPALRNDKVDAMDVTLKPGEAQTFSNARPAVIVYFTDGSLEVAARAVKVKRGDAVFQPAQSSTSKNTGASEVHFARIEFLGKGLAENWGMAGLSPNYKPILENQYARVYDIRISAGGKEPQHTHRDRVVVCLSGAQMRHILPGGSVQPSQLKTGDIAWRRGGTHIGQNLGKTDLWVIAVEPK